MFTQYNCVKNTLKGWFCGDLENLDLQTALRSIHNSYMEFLLPIFWPTLIPIARIYRRLKPVDSHARRPAFVIVWSPWYCMVLLGIAWYCIIPWYCMVLHGIQLSYTILHYLALS